MKTVADLSFDDFRKIGEDAAEHAVADLRAAGLLPPEASDDETRAVRPSKRLRLGKPAKTTRIVKLPDGTLAVKRIRRSYRSKSEPIFATSHPNRTLRRKKR